MIIKSNVTYRKYLVRHYEVVADFAEGQAHLRFLHGIFEDLKGAFLKLLDVRKQVVVVLASDQDLEGRPITGFGGADEHTDLGLDDVDFERLSHSGPSPSAFRVVPGVVVLHFDYGDSCQRIMRFVTGGGGANKSDPGSGLVDSAVSLSGEVRIAKIVRVVASVVEDLRKHVRVKILVEGHGEIVVR